ncbi:hypothetical protein HD806DRAFT_8717 [Xylariaceae sp. AK1471]|nr:hypothetical protein HD806DRAFT_8717 [Xylariaceae sp. AK1471]
MSSRKVPWTFTFHQSGVQPPLFVAGTFSDPPWKPQEMDASIDQRGDAIFTKQIMVNESSEIQYKFRHASGDWWALDPDADAVTDDQGNVNSLLRSPTQNAAQETTPEQNVHAVKPLDRAAGDDSHPSNDAEASVAPTDSREMDAANPDLPIGKSERDELRRLSLPPMEEVASTAAEVADSASQLDSDDPGVDDGDDELPMFSHECFAFKWEHQPSTETLESQQENPDHSSEGVDELDIDYDDPRLERFPSDRDSIVATMRRLSTTVQADPTVVDPVSLSPVIKARLPDAGGPSGRTGSFSVGNASFSYEQPESLGRPSIGTGASRASLHSIAEGDEAANGNATRHRAENLNTPAQHIGPIQGRKASSVSSNSNEDEGIAMSIASPKSSINEDTRIKTTNDKAHAIATNDSATNEEATTNETHLTTDHTSIGSCSPKSIQPNDQAGLQKPTNSERPHSSSSAYSLRDSNQNGNWLHIFLRTVFIDWIGGLVCWLCGRGRKPVLPKVTRTGAVIILVTGISVWALQGWLPSMGLPTSLRLPT